MGFLVGLALWIIVTVVVGLIIMVIWYRVIKPRR